MSLSDITVRRGKHTARSLFHHRRAPHRHFVCFPFQTTLAQQQRGCQVETNLPCRSQLKAKYKFYVFFFFIHFMVCSTSVLYESQNRHIMIFHRRPQLSCALHFEFLVAGRFLVGQPEQPCLTPHSFSLLPLLIFFLKRFAQKPRWPAQTWT